MSQIQRQLKKICWLTQMVYFGPHVLEIINTRYLNVLSISF